MDIINILATELGVKQSQIEATIKLIDEGNTIPFIARYRKEVTGSLNDEVLRQLDERLTYLRNLSQRQEQIIEIIKEQGKLTPELEKEILLADTLVKVEDLYRPYKQKKQTRATIAKDKGLEELANIILSDEDKEDIEVIAQRFLSDKEGLEVNSVQEAIEGACDIIAEMISDNAMYRDYIRDITFNLGFISSNVKSEDLDEKSVYENYYEYEESIKTILSHRILAINRGEKEKILNIKIVSPKEEILEYLFKNVIQVQDTKKIELLENTIVDSYKRLIEPSIERQIRTALTEDASDKAIKVFAKNLKELLMQSPIKDKVVLGWDPAFRTGCKLSIVDKTGKVLDTTVIFPTMPQNKVNESKIILKELIKKYNIDIISIGNGTASRESEAIVADLLKEIPTNVSYCIVNEAGASVYSASKLASEEFPNFDVGQRSATSIARRLQDPLSELVKIDPKSIGVGQYQHDMNQTNLSNTLKAVVEDSVNEVGVDLNTASFAILSYISGISKTLAQNIVKYREENGEFKTRKELLKVSKLGPKAFEQSAGFMRIRDGLEPLDATCVHPESYHIAKKLLEKLQLDETDLKKGGIKDLSKKIVDYDILAKELDTTKITLIDIVKELEKPAIDPRDDKFTPILRSDILEMEDIKEGMILKGTVRNVMDFGAFVDIGVHQDALVHISKMSKKFIKHPFEVVKLGDIVEVKVISIDIPKKRIGLSMIIE